MTINNTETQATRVLFLPTMLRNTSANKCINVNFNGLWLALQVMVMLASHHA
jgi:hypothetical protein